MMIGVSNHLRNARYLGSMKPFSVSVIGSLGIASYHMISYDQIAQRKKDKLQNPQTSSLKLPCFSSLKTRSIHSPRDLYIDPPNINMEIGWHLSFLPSTNGKRTVRNSPKKSAGGIPKRGGFCRWFRNGRSGLPKRDRFVVDGLVVCFWGRSEEKLRCWICFTLPESHSKFFPLKYGSRKMK